MLTIDYQVSILKYLLETRRFTVQCVQLISREYSSAHIADAQKNLSPLDYPWQSRNTGE